MVCVAGHPGGWPRFLWVPEVFGDPSEDAVDDLVGEVDGLGDGGEGGDDAGVDLALAGEANAGDHAGAEVDEGGVGAGDVGVGVEDLLGGKPTVSMSESSVTFGERTEGVDGC